MSSQQKSKTALTGKAAGDLYKAAYTRINDATKAGFFLEAITLIENLICDRLVSLVKTNSSKDIYQDSFSDIVKKVVNSHYNILASGDLKKDLDTWRKARNKAFHDMARLYCPDNTSTWNERTKDLPATAKDGLRILREIDRRYRKLNPKPKIARKA